MSKSNRTATVASPFVRTITGSAALFAAVTGTVEACGHMGFGGGIVVMAIHERDLGLGTAIQGGIQVSAAAGDTCFIATDVSKSLIINDTRLTGPAGDEFGEFVEDPELAAKFGRRYRAWSARAQRDIDLEEFVVEFDYRTPTPLFGLPRTADAFVKSSIGLGETDGDGVVFDHASITRVQSTEIFFAD